MLYLDGVDINDPNGALFRWVKAPTSNDRLQNVTAFRWPLPVGLKLAEGDRLVGAYISHH